MIAGGARTLTPVSTAAYRLEPLTAEETAGWDELIAPYETRELFHRRAWLDYLAESRGLEIAMWAIRSGPETLGYFCGGILKKGPFRILGSPLKSWGTNFMGPVTGLDIDQAELLGALDRLARQERFAMTELEHPSLSSPALEAAGFEAVADWTFIVTLTPGDRDAMWRALDSTCRNRIRKAAKAGLVVEDSDDPAVVEEYFDQYAALMHRKGLAPPFPRQYVRSLYTHLRKADSLFALAVKDQAGRVLATGLFPHDDRTMYFWSGASWPDAHDLCPNDSMHWRAMCLAAERGLSVYNMSGHGRFKRKFGGRLVMVRRWHKCYWLTARWGRSGYELWFQKRQAVGGWWHGMARQALPHRPEAAEPTGAAPSRFRWSDVWRAPLHDFPIRDEILFQYLRLAPSMDVLEVGPGSGVTAFRVARQVRHLTLLDVAPANITQLQATFRGVASLQFVCADVCQPELPQTVGRRFDAIYGLEVFELVPDPAACLKNLARLLRPGGALLLQFPNYPPPKSPGVTYFARRAELDRLLGEAGFSSWTVSALQLRQFAQTVYHLCHERPIRLYRRLRGRDSRARPLVYDDSWAFQHGQRLEPYKYLLHTTWAGMTGLMRLGGDCFERRPVGDDILNRNLLVLARR